MNQREIVLKFVKTVPATEVKVELTNIHIEELSRIPNIGENFHYVSGLKYDFLTAGKVVKIETILYNSRHREVIEITIDISK